MNLDDLVKLMQARLAALNNARASALALGDLAALSRLDAEIAETEITLSRLNTLV